MASLFLNLIMWDPWRVVAFFAYSARRPGNLDILWVGLGLVGLILLGAILVVWADRWRRQTLSEGPASENNLELFRELHEKGLLSTEEYDRIRGHQGREPGTSGPSLPSASQTANTVEPDSSHQQAPPGGAGGSSPL